ncbi:unknown protein [Desulfotalea psychrophila LSv54]|uniref:Uncharacterized protein n=2 Tax=Desulfotalea psychrophila TaxID=84980 RepID=Q6APA5_DESPS|nr:unknown protein [Desulfotalea psychrophila LSv54]
MENLAMTEKKAPGQGAILEEIKTFVCFAVAPEKQALAMELVCRYQEDSIVQQLLCEHYSSLPEAVEEPILAIRELSSQQGIYCLLLVAESVSFFYLVSADQVVYAGCRAEELSADLLRFIDLGDWANLDKLVAKPEQFPLYGGLEKRKAVCSVCGVAEGDAHLLGCLVEICPWCDGQLNTCNCRFEKLGVDEINSEEELEKFEKLLAEKGRVPFSAEQGLAYPGSSKGLDPADD